jgi:hypothetical protein
LYNRILVALDKSRLLKRLIAAKYVLLPAKILIHSSITDAIQSYKYTIPLNGTEKTWDYDNEVSW